MKILYFLIHICYNNAIDVDYNNLYFFMIHLKDPYLDLATQYIETDRCIIIPFSTKSIIDLRELTHEFRRANVHRWINDMQPDIEDEFEYVKNTMIAIGNNEVFENFIVHRDSGDFLWAVWINATEEESVNIWVWIRVDQQGKWYGTEAYAAIVDWAKKNTDYKFLRHVTHVDNEPFGRIALKFHGKLQPGRVEWNKLMFHIPL